MNKPNPEKYLRTILSNMKQRCLNPRHESFPYYGARGVRIFGPWMNSEVFVQGILVEIGPRPTDEIRHNGLSVWELDRINSFGNYEPGNVRWLRWEQNQKNKRPRTKSSRPRPREKKEKLPPYLMFTNTTSGILVPSRF